MSLRLIRSHAVVRSAAIIFVLATVGFIWIAYEVGKGAHTETEAVVFRMLRPEGRPAGPAGMENVIRDVTALGSAAPTVALTAMILGYLLLVRKFRTAAVLICATAGGQVLNYALKNSFDRSRPDPMFHLVETQSSSFPSGHAMAGSIFYLTAGTLLARTLPTKREKVYLMSCCILLIAAVGFSRVYLGVHYPSDVAAGWMAGAAWAALCWGVAEFVLARRELASASRIPNDE